jgi:hypothetical protein
VSVAPILTRALRYGGFVAVAVAVVAGGIGLVVAGVPGLLVAGRVTKGDTGSPAFFGIVLGVWALKFVVFIVVALLFRGQAAVDPYVFFFSVIAAVLGSLLADIVAVVRTRVPYVSDVVLPGEGAASDRS